MKRSFIIFFFLYVSLFRVNAQNAIPITLDKDEEVPVDIYGCNLTFKKGGNPGNTRVDINLKYDGDESGNDVVLLFNKKYENEKELKKDLKKNKTFPKITFDKKKLKNIVVNNIGGLNDLKKLERTNVAKLSSKLDTTAIITLPVYFGKYKGKSKTKLIITDYKNMNFKIKIPEQIDNDYPELLRRYEELNDNVRKASPFCNNPAHTASKNLEDKYKKDKEQLIAKINSKLVSVYGPTNINNYNDLYNKVKGIVFEERDCGKHKVASTTTKSVHHCDYCNKSLSDISKTLQDIFFDLRNGKINKSKAMNDARPCYSACTTCPNLNKLWKRGGNEKRNIESYYTRIKDFKE